MSPIEFPLEALLNPISNRSRLPGIMVWAKDNTESEFDHPDSFWLESGAPKNCFRLAWARHGKLRGDAVWHFGQKMRKPAFDNLQGLVSTLVVDWFEIKGPAFDDLVVPVDEQTERVERICKFANTLSVRMKCVLLLDQVSWDEAKRFSKSEGSALSQVLEIAELQTRILGSSDKSLYDHQQLAKQAKAAFYARDPESAIVAIKGGWLRRAFASLRRSD